MVRLRNPGCWTWTPRLADREPLGKRLEVLPVHRANEKGFQPFDNVIASAQTYAAPEVGLTVVIEANHAVDPTLFQQEDLMPGTHVAVRKHDIAGTRRLPQLMKHSHFAIPLACVPTDGQINHRSTGE
jgi:hypothetical protein